MIVFVRTKVATVELSEKLEARGYNAAPLSGDVPQSQRERTVDRLKKRQARYPSRHRCRRPWPRCRSH